MSRRTEKSDAAFSRARKVLVGGVNSPVRSFAAVGGTPPFLASAKGATLTDIDGNRYVDYVGSYGPAILGHAHETVVTAVNKAVQHGSSFGAPTELETRLAEAVVSAIASIEKVRFVSSGTEAVMTAIRLARGVTNRDKIIKCVGCYHGHCDALLVSAGSGAATLGVPSSPGVPRGATAETLLVPYNDLEAVKRTLSEQAENVAAVLVEPVAGNMGVVPPQAGYLSALRTLCDEHNTLLIFDEVMTGFRLAYGGAQALYDVRPDITTLGKIIGGGMPVGAVGGSAEIMAHLTPEGPIYQAGTLSGNPPAMAAGLATLEALRTENFYENLEKKSAFLEAGLRREASRANLGEKVCFNRVGSMLCCYLTPGPVVDYASAATGSDEAFATFFHAMLDGGVYIAPSRYEAWFVSAAHSDADIENTIKTAGQAFDATAEKLHKF